MFRPSPFGISPKQNNVRVLFSKSISTFTWEAKWAQTGMRFHFGWKFHFGVQSALYLCSHELRWNETQNGMDFISLILTEMKFQTGMRFLCEHNLPPKKWISTDSLDVAFNAHVHLKLNAGMDFISVILREIKFCVNRICFHVGLKSQTGGMSSFRLSWKRTLIIWQGRKLIIKFDSIKPVNISRPNEFY